jgi:hypothetical protein
MRGSPDGSTVEPDRQRQETLDLVAQQSLKLGWGYECVWQPSPPPEGASNLQHVLYYADAVSDQNWSTGDCLCVGDANVLAEELEPL